MYMLARKMRNNICTPKENKNRKQNQNENNIIYEYW